MPQPAPFKGREILFIPDPDEAGAGAERRLRKLLEPAAAFFCNHSTFGGAPWGTTIYLRWFAYVVQST